MHLVYAVIAASSVLWAAYPAGNAHASTIENNGSLTSESFCGRPEISSSAATGVYLWRDCPSGGWHLRVYAGGSVASVSGEIISDRALSLITRHNLESNDVVDTSGSGRLAFNLHAGGTEVDGFNFTLPSEASGSLTLTGGGVARVGSGAVIASSPVSIGEASSSEGLYDQYGGYTKAFAGASSGSAFRVRKINGRWALITPKGNGFFSMGPNHVADGYEQRPFLLTRDYGGDRAKLAAQVVSNIKEWGYNTVGYGGLTESARLIPHFLRFSVEGPASASGKTPYADVFDAAVVSRNRSQARTAALRGVANPYLIGYLYNDAALWDLTTSREKSATKQHYVDFIRSLGSDQPGRMRYEQFLREEYGTISRLNSAYGTSFSSFGAITESSLKASVRPAVIADDNEFLGILAEQFYRTTREALRRLQFSLGPRLRFERDADERGCHLHSADDWNLRNA